MTCFHYGAEWGARTRTSELLIKLFLLCSRKPRGILVVAIYILGFKRSSKYRTAEMVIVINLA